MKASLMGHIETLYRMGALLVSFLALWVYWIVVTTIVPRFISDLLIIVAAAGVVCSLILLFVLAICAFMKHANGWGLILLGICLAMGAVSLKVPALAHRSLIRQNRTFISWAREALPIGQPVLVRTGDRGLNIPYRWEEHLFAMRVDDGGLILGTPIFDGAFVMSLDTNRAVPDDPWELAAIQRAGVLRAVADQHSGVAEKLLGERDEEDVIIVVAMLPDRQLVPSSLAAVVAIRRGSSVFFLIPVDRTSCVVAIRGEAETGLWESGYWIADGWTAWHGQMQVALKELGLPGPEEILQLTGSLIPKRRRMW